MADAWRMAQEIDMAIPVLEKLRRCRRMEIIYLIGQSISFEDRMKDSIRAIEAI